MRDVLLGNSLVVAYKWVNDVWWRDWVLWTGVVVATGNLVAAIAAEDTDQWWWLAWRWGYSFAFVVAALGFVRTVVRTYRAPTPTEE